jgi:hypothetical protein
MQNKLKYILVESRYKTYCELTTQIGIEPAAYLDYNQKETNLIIKHFNKYPHMEKFQHAQCKSIARHDMQGLLSKEFFEVYRAVLPDQNIYLECLSHLSHTQETKHLEKTTAANSSTDSENKFLIASIDNFNMLKKSKATHVIFFDIPHGASSLNLYLVAKAMGLKIIICRQFMDNTLYITDSITNSMRKDVTGNNNAGIINFNKTIVAPSYMKNKAGDISFPRKMLFKIFKRSILIFPLFTTYHRLSVRYLLYKFKEDYYSYTYKKYYHKEHVSNTPELATISYVYFPLHFQPEMTTSILGGKYTNQASALIKLRQKLPPEVMIIVKENPIQGWYMREESFFATIKSLPNTIFIATSVATYDLIKNAKAVASISGTACYESLFYRKPAIYFGNPFYQDFEGTFKFDDIEDITKVLNYTIDENKLMQSANNFNNKLFKGSTDIFNLAAFNPNYDKQTFDLDNNFSQIINAVVSYIKQTA